MKFMGCPYGSCSTQVGNPLPISRNARSRRAESLVRASGRRGISRLESRARFKPPRELPGAMERSVMSDARPRERARPDQPPAATGDTAARELDKTPETARSVEMSRGGAGPGLARKRALSLAGASTAKPLLFPDIALERTGRSCFSSSNCSSRAVFGKSFTFRGILVHPNVDERE